MIQPNTKIHLLNNIPLSNDHQRDFSDKTTQTDYFMSKISHSFTDFTYQREFEAVKVPIAYDDIVSANYLMYQNTSFSGKWFYATIVRKEYINPNTTRLYFELDVFQTWLFDFTFNQSFIEREHMRRFYPSGNPIINTVEEGLDYGTDYQTVSVTQYQPYVDLFFLVIVATSRLDAGADPAFPIEPILNGYPQPFTYYVHPFRKDGTTPQSKIGGTTPSISTIDRVLKALYTEETAVGKVANIYVTEYTGLNITYDGTALTFASSEVEMATITDLQPSGTTASTLRLIKVPDYTEKVEYVEKKYDGFTPVEESKLMMFPYCLIQLTDFKGTSIDIKPEYVDGQNLTIVTKGSIGTSNKISYHLDSYLITNIDNESEASLDHAVINNSPNDVPIVTDLYSAFLQGNRNSLQQQKSAINENALFGIVNSTVGGGIGKFLTSGGVAGMTLDVTGGLINATNQIESMIAKERDIMNVPLSLNSMGGNTAFEYGNGYKGLYIIKKEIRSEARKRLEDFFKMYGYKSNELKEPNFKDRTSYNYLKTIGANIKGNIPSDDLNKLKSLFDNGLTVWHGDFVGDYSRSNSEV